MKIKVIWPVPDEASAKIQAENIPESIVDPRFEFRVTTTKGGAEAIDSFYNLLYENLCVLEEGLKSEDEGYNGVLVNSVLDYGVQELRSRLNVPVMGAGLIGMHTAAMLGNKFSIVTIWPRSYEFAYKRLLKEYGLEDRCVSIRSVSQTLVQVANNMSEGVKKVAEGDDSVVAKVKEECFNAIKEDNADVILLGCTCMAPIHERIQKEVPVPVINPLTLAYKFTELLTGLGLGQSKKTYPPPEHGKDEQIQIMLDHASGTKSAKSNNARD